MLAEPVRFSRKSESLVVGKGPKAFSFELDDGEVFFGPSEIIEPASASALRRALVDAATYWESSDFGVGVSPVDAEEFDRRYSPMLFRILRASGDSLMVETGFEGAAKLDEAGFPGIAEKVLGPLLARLGWQFIDTVLVGADSQGSFWTVRLEVDTRGRTVREIYTNLDKVEALLDAIGGDGLRRETVLDLLRAGMADVLVGQREGPWLDVKSQDYDLSSDRGKISLAQDVARFANAEHGGIVVVGMAAKKVAGSEVITGLRPIPASPHGTMRHRRIVDGRLFPSPDELTIEEVPVEGGHLLLIHVPPQAEELKPFLVHGAIVGDRVEGAFISILRRRDEDSIPISAASIHSFLAAGRALLSRGVLPPE